MKLLNQLQDIFYDILGYVLPGLFAMILLVPFLFYQHSFAYVFFMKGPFFIGEAISKIRFSGNYFFLCVIICFLAYLFGHLIKNLPFFYKFYTSRFPFQKKKVQKKHKLANPHLTGWIRTTAKEKYRYITILGQDITSRLKSSPDLSICAYLSHCPNTPALVRTYANTNSRFRQCVNNISKYKNKLHFFHSMKIIIGFLLADFMITSVFYTILDFVLIIGSLILIFPNTSSGFSAFLVFGVTDITFLVIKPFFIKACFTFFIYLFYAAFLYEQLRNAYFYKKELYLYIDYMLASKGSNN